MARLCGAHCYGDMVIVATRWSTATLFHGCFGIGDCPRFSCGSLCQSKSASSHRTRGRFLEPFISDRDIQGCGKSFSGVFGYPVHIRGRRDLGDRHGVHVGGGLPFGGTYGRGTGNPYGGWIRADIWVCDSRSGWHRERHYLVRSARYRASILAQCRASVRGTFWYCYGRISEALSRSPAIIALLRIKECERITRGDLDCRRWYFAHSILALSGRLIRPDAVGGHQ